MFTGLIETTGRIRTSPSAAGGARLSIETPLGAELRPGDSIAVNGVCLTVTIADAAGFSADVSPETLRVTSFGSLASGRLVNLERPMRADGRLGGHFVLGHVDAIGRVATLRPDRDCYWLDVDVPVALEPLLITKGSIAVDGISLTVAALSAARFGVQVVPFTWAHTALKDARAGDAVNLEADVIGKYVARLLDCRALRGDEPADLVAELARRNT
jgi:riboflavin synthase